MSRLDGRYADVEMDGMGGMMGFSIRGERDLVPVLSVAETFREWLGVLNGEPERDIWRVDTARGSCELHHLRHPTAEDDDPQGYWVLFRWDD